MLIGNKENPYNNALGYPDPVAYEAIRNISAGENAETSLDAKVGFLIRVIRFIAREAGFDIVNRIEFRHRESGKQYR